MRGRRKSYAWRLIAMLSLLAAVCPAMMVQGWQGMAPSPLENPPLLYDGPDPTAAFFFPPGEPRVALNAPANNGHPAGATSSTWHSATAAESPPLVAPELETNWSEGPTTLGDPWESYGDTFQDEGFVGGGVTEYKDGFFQKLGIQETWIDRSGANDFGMHEIDSFVTVAVPAPNRDWPLLISPTFNVRLLDGPRNPDLPSRLYETYLDLLWLPRISSRWTGIIGVAPSYFGDFEVEDSVAFRVTGKGLIRFDWKPDRLQLFLGVLYLNRANLRVLPAGGIIWVPNDAKRYELLFPRPKLAHRITLGPDYEDWLYLGGEFGGNTYGIQRVSGDDELITLSDIRVFVGLERKRNGGAGYRLEAGYVFARRVEYDSGIPDIDAEDAAILRGGFTF